MRQNNIRMIIAIPLAASVLLTLLGCPKANPKPFIQFSESIQELRTGADAALTINDEENQERFIEQTAAASLTSEGADVINNLMLTTDPRDPFAWHMEKTPLFMKSQSFRSGVYTLNTALVKYAELLKELSSPELLSTEQFDDLTKDLNANLGSASTSLGIKDAGKELAIFSVAATEILHTYLEKQRKDALLEALKENHDNLQELAKRMQHAVRLATSNLNQNYTDESGKLIEILADPKTKDLNKKKDQVRKLVEINQRYVHRIAVMQALHESYAALPRVNSDMIKLVENPKFGASTLKEIFENGKHLKNLHDELVKAEKPDGDTKEGEK